MAFGIRIRELTTSGGDDALTALPDGVVAIVGPNNSGKSALLRELFQYLGHPPGYPPPERRIVGELGVDREGDGDELVEWLETHAYSQLRGVERVYKRANVEWHPVSGLVQSWQAGPGFGPLSAFIAFLAQAEGRLGLVGGSATTFSRGVRRV